MKFRGYDKTLMDISYKRIILLSEKMKVQLSNLFYLPIKRSLYTVQRSPHIDKDSREQFEVRLRKATCNVHFNNYKYLQVFLNALYYLPLKGTEIRLIGNYKTKNLIL